MEQEQGHVNTSCGATATAFAQGVAASAHHTSYETLMREAAVARRGPLIVAVHSAFGQALTLDTAAHALVWREAERLLDVAAALGVHDLVGDAFDLSCEDERQRPQSNPGARKQEAEPIDGGQVVDAHDFTSSTGTHSHPDLPVE